jgi:two-component system, chemotaxis family, protein-glutamate methylesterase/glutaminase
VNVTPVRDAPPHVTRVLVVDDAVVVRQVVARALATESGLEVVGLAANGRVAIAMMDRVRPDVVVLDLEMPEMNGLETLAAIRGSHPNLPVIVYSHLSEQGATATLEALALGATDFALKPRADGIGLAVEEVRRELVPQILALAPRSARSPLGTKRVAGGRPSTVSAIVVATSTGGPNALAVLLADLPADFRAPVLIVQHMPAVFTATLAVRLDGICPLPVVEARHGEAVVPGQVYIAPGGFHMEVTRRAGKVFVRLHEEAKENSCRPAADVLFRSAVTVYGAEVLAVVLTGMGRDGLEGARAVRAAGGSVIAESETTATVTAMPHAVAAAGLADVVLPIDRVADECARRESIGRTR